MSKIRNHFSISYARYSHNAQKDFKLAASVMLMLLLYRLFVMFYYRDGFQAQTGSLEYLFALFNGIRYDAVVAGYITVFPFLTSLLSLFLSSHLPNGGLRTFFLLFFIFTALALLPSHFLYYMEFHENFSHLALNIIYDDAVAVIQTTWRQYPLGKAIVAAAGIGALYFFNVRAVIRKPFVAIRRNPEKRPVTSFIKGLLWVLLFFVMIRGSLGPRPVEPKDGSVTSDQQLNNHVINPYMAMMYAVEGHLRARSVNGIDTFLSGDTVDHAVQRYFHSPSGNNLDHMMIRRAPGTVSPPKHIFLIVMESLDAWNLQEKYRNFKLLPNMEALGKDGILLKKFLSASNGTMTSLAAIITGLPDAGVVTNYQQSSQVPYPTSIAPQFKELGYRTRFFYGGYLGWQRIHDFCIDQGFDEVFGGGHMGNWLMKEWGVDDHVLFDFIQKTVQDPRPSFNVVLSTTYHSPYDIDIYKWGFPYKRFPDGINSGKATVSVEVFGHLWYTDKVLGDFIRSVHEQNRSAVFAVTGDHRSHNFISRTYSKYERFAVPLLLFGNGLNMPSAQCNRIAGSHMDIGPTLIELSAPQGFVYHSMGSNLLDLSREQLGFGRKLMITPSHLIDIKGGVDTLPFNDGPAHPVAEMIASDSAQRIRDHYAIGWWRIMKGPELP